MLRALMVKRIESNVRANCTTNTDDEEEENESSTTKDRDIAKGVFIIMFAIKAYNTLSEFDLCNEDILLEDVIRTDFTDTILGEIF